MRELVNDYFASATNSRTGEFARREVHRCVRDLGAEPGSHDAARIEDTIRKLFDEKVLERPSRGWYRHTGRPPGLALAASSRASRVPNVTIARRT